MSDGVRLFHDVFIFADGKIQLGDNVSIQAGTILKAGVGASLDIGTNTTIESSCSIQNRRSEWRIGNHVWISSDCMIFSREQENEGQFLIGDGSCISNGTLIDTCGDVMIGNEVAIGHNCTIYTHNHNYCDTTKAAWRGGVTIGSVSIHDGAWIGSNVTILPGVTIARRSVIAAGAMVTKDVPAESVFGGVPAQFIKSASSSGHQHGR